MSIALSVIVAETISRAAFPNWREYHNGRFIVRAVQPGFLPFLMGKPGFDGYFAHNSGDFRHRIRINEAGHRNDMPVTAADGRVWVVGDSFSFGWGHDRERIFSSLIERQTGLPTYNVASPGTDVCGYQALVARTRSAGAPSAVIVGLFAENDLQLYRCRQTDPAPHPPAEGIRLKLLLTEYSALYNIAAVRAKSSTYVLDLLYTLGVIAEPHRLLNKLSQNPLSAEVASTVDALAELHTIAGPQSKFAVALIPARFEVRDGHPVF